jgi:hypothetical protein
LFIARCVSRDVSDSAAEHLLSAGMGDAGPGAFDEARRTFKQMGVGSALTSGLIDEVVSLGFEWGVSDGN